jgi:hypothetical protein
MGLACDNILSVDIVTADGQLRTASKNVNQVTLTRVHACPHGDPVCSSSHVHLFSLPHRPGLVLGRAWGWPQLWCGDVVRIPLPPATKLGLLRRHDVLLAPVRSASQPRKHVGHCIPLLSLTSFSRRSLDVAQQWMNVVTSPDAFPDNLTLYLVHKQKGSYLDLLPCVPVSYSVFPVRAIKLNETRPTGEKGSTVFAVFNGPAEQGKQLLKPFIDLGPVAARVP